MLRTFEETEPQVKNEIPIAMHVRPTHGLRSAMDMRKSSRQESQSHNEKTDG